MEVMLNNENESYLISYKTANFDNVTVHLIIEYFNRLKKTV